MDKKWEVKLEDIVELKDNIYLDWNIVKEIIDRKNLDLETLVLKLRDRFQFYYSDAHLDDRSSRFKTEYIENIVSDLRVFNSICKGLRICNNGVTQEFMLAKRNIIEDFYIKLEEKNKTKLPRINMPNLEIDVDLNQIDESHPLYGTPFLEKIKENGGVWSNKITEKYMEENKEKFFSGHSEYKIFRNIISKFENSNYLENCPKEDRENLKFFVDSLKVEEEELVDRFIPSLVNFYKVSMKQDYNEYSLDQKLIYSYMLLDFFKPFKDKITKKNTMDNVRRDANHLFWAQKANYLITKDAKTAKKMKFIYGVFGIEVQVLNIDGFIEKFNDCNFKK